MRTAKEEVHLYLLPNLQNTNLQSRLFMFTLREL
jgi:hypothetical protein